MKPVQSDMPSRIKTKRNKTIDVTWFLLNPRIGPTQPNMTVFIAGDIGVGGSFRYRLITMLEQNRLEADKIRHTNRNIAAIKNMSCLVNRR